MPAATGYKGHEGYDVTLGEGDRLTARLLQVDAIDQYKNAASAQILVQSRNLLANLLQCIVQQGRYLEHQWGCGVTNLQIAV